MKSWPRFNTITILPSLLAGVLAVTLLWPGGAVYAADQCGSDSFDAVSAPAEYISGPIVNYTLEQPFGGKASVETIGEYIQLVYSFALGIVGIIAVVLIMFGGLRWLAAAGNESVITEAKEIITSAVTGLVIALLSYTILTVVNPQTLKTDVTVFKIPIPIQCDYADPETKAIPDITPGLKGNGHSLCPGAVIALQEVVDVMLYGTDGKDGPEVGLCPGCTLDVSSGVRSHEKQRELRDCYDRAVLNNVKDGSVCPAGCDSCNLAEKVCCSEHEHANAVDIALTNVPTDRGMAATSAGFRKTKYNNGGAGGLVNLSSCAGVPDGALCATQRLTNQVMTAIKLPGGKGTTFTGISKEWWHFNFKGECKLDPSTDCTVSTVTHMAKQTYCQASGSDSDFDYARCKNGVPDCSYKIVGSTQWFAISTCTDDGKAFVFSTDASRDPANPGDYYKPPDCIVSE